MNFHIFVYYSLGNICHIEHNHGIFPRYGTVSNERGFQTDERDIARSREKQGDRGSNGAISNNELTEKNLVETHEGGLEQGDGENKNKLEEALGAGAKVLD